MSSLDFFFELFEQNDIRTKNKSLVLSTEKNKNNYPFKQVNFFKFYLPDNKDKTKTEMISGMKV